MMAGLVNVLIDAWNFLTWGRSQPKMPPAHSQSIKEAIDRYYWYTVHGRGARRMLGRELTEKELKDLIRRIEKEDGYPLSIEVDLGDFDTPHIFFPERYPLRDNLIGFWDFFTEEEVSYTLYGWGARPEEKESIIGGFFLEKRPQTTTWVQFRQSSYARANCRR